MSQLASPSLGVLKSVASEPAQCLDVPRRDTVCRGVDLQTIGKHRLRRSRVPIPQIHGQLQTDADGEQMEDLVQTVASQTALDHSILLQVIAVD
jgi:hypothetical protein